MTLQQKQAFEKLLKIVETPALCFNNNKNLNKKKTDYNNQSFLNKDNVFYVNFKSNK